VVAFGSRAATMLLAVAVVGFVALRRFTRPAPSVQVQGRRAARVALFGLGPAVVVFGWFYVRNILLYGDVGASQYLLEMFRRERRGSVLDQMVQWPMWSSIYEGLMSPTTRRRIVPPGSLVITLVAAFGVVMVFVTGRVSSNEGSSADAISPELDGDRATRASTLRWQIALGLVTVGLMALTLAQHASGGGNAHARYAMPAIGVAAVLLVMGMERIWSRWAPLGLVVIAGWWALINLPVDVDPGTMARNRDDGQLAPYPLRVLPLSDGWRTASGVLIAVGVVVAAGVLLSTLRAASRPVPGAGAVEPTAPAPQDDGELVTVS